MKTGIRISRISCFAALVAMTCLIVGTANAQAPEITWTLDDAVKQLNRQANDFQTLLARVEVVRNNKDGEEVSREKGTIYIAKNNKMRIDADAPNARTILVTNSNVLIYLPARSVVERYSLSKHKNRLEPFIRSGFTFSGKKLKDDNLVTSLGENDVGESRSLGLELTPKKEKERQIVAKIQLWIDQASWMPTRQIITDTESGDTLTVTYTHMARNLKLNPDLFKAKWPKGTKKKSM